MVLNKYEKWMLFIIGLILANSEIASAQLQCNVVGTNETGVCVSIYNCPWMVDALQTPPKIKITQPIILRQCGVVDGKIGICCSNGKKKHPIERNSNHLNITNHPNLHLLPSSECGPITNSKLLRTDKLSLAEMPWMARLQYETSAGLQLLCEGSIINNRYILTTGVCISSLEQGIKLHSIVLGEHDTRTELDCEIRGTNTKCNPPKQEFSIEKTITHEGYNQPRFANNIGLIRLSKPIIFDQVHIQPVCLPTSNMTLNFKLKELLISAWGKSQDRVYDNTPSKVHYSVPDMVLCREKYDYYRFTDHEKQFCAYEEGLENSCRGAAGSSLVHPLNSNGYKYFQFGMLSYETIKCEDDPAIYTKIQKYMDWILDNIEP